MKTDIILAGVGGQGILSTAAIIAASALQKGLYVKQSEIHGMSQRGGDVQSNLRISDKPIASDLIPMGKADIVLGLEPIEALRYVHYLKKEGWLIVDSTPYKNIPDYPPIEEVLAEIQKYPNHIIINAESEAKKLGSSLVANVILIGAVSPYLGLEYEDLEAGIKEIFGRKGETVVEMNLKALKRGLELSREFVNK